MKMTSKIRRSTGAITVLVFTLLLFCVQTGLAFPIITDVLETGGDNEPTDTVTAKWTGVTFVNGIAGEPIPGSLASDPYTVGLFGNGAPTFVDRNHRYTNAEPVAIPAYLVGNEYIMSGNDNRDNNPYTLDVTVATPVYVYMLIDNRLGSPNSPNSTPPAFGPTKMQWILDEVWEPMLTGANRTSNSSVPDEVGVDEGADGSINQWYSVYRKFYPAGTFRLKQADNAGQNMYGVVIASAAPPVAPTLMAVSGDGKVTLNWTVSPGAAAYVVRRSPTAGGPYSVVVTNTTTRYVDTSVVNGSTYYYVVSAFNAAGDSGNSNEAVATPKAAPTGIVAIGGVEQAEVQWNPFPGAVSYTLRRSLTSGGPYTTVATGIAGTSRIDTGLLTGRQYYYVVVAQLGGGDSGQSDEASALTAPGAPAPVSATVYAATVFSVAWNTTDPVVTSFAIEESFDNNVFQEIGTAAANVRSFLVTGIFPSETHYFRVRAINATGSSPPSTVATVTSPVTGWNVNFANALNGTPANDPAPTPAGYAQDIGEVYGLRPNGFVFGWNRDVTVDSRWRKSVASPDLRYDTFNHLQKILPSAIWELEMPNGFYSVHIVSGDATAVDSVFQFDVEGVVTTSKTPSAGNNWQEFDLTVIVNDGRLTVNSGPSAANNKIAFIDVYPAVAAPIVIGTQPQGQTVEQNRSVTLSVTLSGGSSPFSYRWLKDGAEVPGSATFTANTNASLTIPLPQPDQSGQYTVEISNYAGTVTSAAATLLVQPDTTAPTVASAASLDGRTVGVCFSEAMSDTLGQLSDYFTYVVISAAFPEGQSPASVVVRPGARAVALTMNEAVTGPFTVRVGTIIDLAGNNLNSAANSAASTVGGFTAGDIGAPALAGSHFACDNQTIEIVGGGADIWGNADQMYFVGKPAAGDFDARVRVVGLAGLNAVTKAALIARDGVAPGAPALHLSVNPVPPGRNQIELGARTVLDGTTAAWGSVFTPAGIPDVWLRLARLGNTFTGYRSADGQNWTVMGTSTPALPSTVMVGLGVTAHDNAQLATGTFAGFSVDKRVSILAPGFDGANFSAGVQTELGVNYRIEFKNALSEPTWQLLTTLAGSGGILSFSDPVAASPTGARIYRVVIQ